MTLMQGRSVYGLASKKARYPAFAAIGLFFVAQIITHDAGIYSDIEAGRTSINSASQLFIPEWSHEFDVLMLRILATVIVGLIIYAIVIRVAQRKAMVR